MYFLYLYISKILLEFDWAIISVIPGTHPFLSVFREKAFIFNYFLAQMLYYFTQLIHFLIN